MPSRIEPLWVQSVNAGMGVGILGEVPSTSGEDLPHRALDQASRGACRSTSPLTCSDWDDKVCFSLRVGLGVDSGSSLNSAFTECRAQRLPPPACGEHPRERVQDSSTCTSLVSFASRCCHEGLCWRLDLWCIVRVPQAQLARAPPARTAFQDGHCGNFDGDAANDSLAAVEQRLGKSVSRNQLLFRTYTIPESGDPSQGHG